MCFIGQAPGKANALKTTPTLIDRCLKEGRLSLNEAESKIVLREHGIPVVQEAIAKDVDQAVAKAEAIGFPVVLKGLGSQLTHKTELGVVRINLRSIDEVRHAFNEIKQACGRAWEGCLLQPMVTGRREFVAGMFKDPQFGPVIMFGLGGIFTEAIGDVVFRIAPLTVAQAGAMLEELASGTLLHDFRGEKAADRDQLIHTLMGLSQIAMTFAHIKEIDVNPLIIGADGAVTAVDALVVIDDAPPAPELSQKQIKADQQRTQRINAVLQTMMYPKSVAVVGVARTQIRAYPGIYRCIRNFGYSGRLYPINPRAEEIDGVKAYPSLSALPEPVDLVSLSVPAHKVPEALKDCIASGNKNVHIFTSGFQESGEEEGKRLYAEIEKIAREGELNIVGPNCMGIHVPASRLLTWTKASDKSGPVAIVSQSGGHAQDFVNICNNRCGLYFSKVISYGNALNLDSTDYLAYLAQDDETRIIALYLEGVKDGGKLRQLLTEINRSKPIVMIKGGITESGARTVASHTGSLAGSEKIWQALYKQTGVVPAATLEEMADAVMALHQLPACRGRGVAILGTGGGIGVAAADTCAKAGLTIPALSTQVMNRLRDYIPPAGNMIRNPIDAHIVLVKLELMGPTLQLLAAEADLDMFIISLHLDWIYGMEEGKHIDRIAAYIADEARQHVNGKPLVVVWRQYYDSQNIRDARVRLEKTLHTAGVPVYKGLDRAVTALAKTAQYYEFQKRDL